MKQQFPHSIPMIPNNIFINIIHFVHSLHQNHNLFVFTKQSKFSVLINKFLFKYRITRSKNQKSRKFFQLKKPDSKKPKYHNEYIHSPNKTQIFCDGMNRLILLLITYSSMIPATKNNFMITTFK